MANRWFEAALPWRWGRARSETIDLAVAAGTLPNAPKTDEVEYGVSGTQNFGGVIKGEDSNPDFDDLRKAVTFYDKMRHSDAQVVAVLQVLKLPLLGATWTAEPPPGGDPVDEAIADFVNACLFDDDAMQDSWAFVLRHILLQLDYGFSPLETIWRLDEELERPLYKLKRLAPRLPRTIHEFMVSRNGDLRGVVQYAPVLSNAFDTADVNALARARFLQRADFKYLVVPGDYCAMFVHRREGDNYMGTSLLRPIWRNYYYKDLAYRIESIRQDRWGVGIPHAKILSGSLSEEAHQRLVDVLKRLRSNEKAYLISPANMDFKILPENTGATTNSGIVGWVDHHDSQMARSILAGFLTMGRDTQGTLGYGSRLTDLFIGSLQGVTIDISAEMKRQIVRRICDLNFDMQRRQYPSVVVRDLDTSDLDGMVDLLAKVANVYITPDDDIESLLRKMLRLPSLDPRFSRAEAKKQAAAPPALGVPGAPPQPGGQPATGALEAPADNANPTPPGKPPVDKPGGPGAQ